MSDDPYEFDPTGGDLADVARRGAREWERDMAAWEGDAEVLRLRQRNLGNVLWEAMQRGDRVSCTIGAHIFTGVLEAARGDLAVLVSADLRVALNVAAIGAVHLQRGPGGRSGDRTYGSMKAYLGMLEVEGTPVRILTREIDVRGRVVVVAADHVLVEGIAGGEWAIAFDALAAVVGEPGPGVSR